MTLRALMTELARECSLLVQSGSEFVLPTSAGSLDRLRQSCREAYRTFMQTDPHWSWLHREILVTLGTGSPDLIDAADLRRYRLPTFVATAPLGDLSLRNAAGVAVWQVKLVAASVLLGQQALLTDAQTPQCVTVRTVPGTTGRQVELLTDAKPDQTYTLRGVFRVHQSWDAEEERHLAGGEHDQTLLRMAVYAFKRTDEGAVGVIDRIKRDADEALSRSLTLDMAARPTWLGVMPDTIEHNPHRTPTARWDGTFQVYGATP
jgi:hypothetical protein